MIESFVEIWYQSILVVYPVEDYVKNSVLCRRNKYIVHLWKSKEIRGNVVEYFTSVFGSNFQFLNKIDGGKQR